MTRQRRTLRIGGLRSGAALMALAAAIASAPAAIAQAAGMGMSDFESARDSFFSSADRNGDFALSSGELMSAMGSSDAEIFDCVDSDGDGLCGYSEYLDFGQDLFLELDSDGDGWLSPIELQ
jgi:hypothetical protein